MNAVLKQIGPRTQRYLITPKITAKMTLFQIQPLRKYSRRLKVTWRHFFVELHKILKFKEPPGVELLTCLNWFGIGESRETSGVKFKKVLSSISENLEAESFLVLNFIKCSNLRSHLALKSRLKLCNLRIYESLHLWNKNSALQCKNSEVLSVSHFNLACN